MRFALLGSTGYVGSEFVRQLAERGHEACLIRRADVNIYDEQALATHLEQIRPDALINAAGYTGKPNVDACERDRTNCLLANAILPGVINAATKRVNLPWGHVSSGCIYSGRRADGAGFTEEDPPNFCFRTNNCSFYSGTKALGEELLLPATNCYIWRIRIPFSQQDGARNYLSKLLRYDTLLDAENSLSHLPEVVSAAIQCFERKIPFGTYNLTNPGSVTTRQVVTWLQEYLVPDRTFKFFADERQFLFQAALTPRSNCVLSSEKLSATGISLQGVDIAVKECLGRWTADASA